MMKSWLLPTYLGGIQRRWKYVLVSTNRDHLAHIARWIEEGRLKTIIDSKYAFEDAPKAFERLRTGRARGKVIIGVSEALK